MSSARKRRILYLSPANYTGTLDALVAEHRRRGHDAVFVTLTRSPEKFDNGICFDLRPRAGEPLALGFRNFIMSRSTISGIRPELPGTPPFFTTNPVHSLFLRLQDTFYGPRIRRLIREHDLLNYDIYHLESGIDFFKDYRLLPGLRAQGKILIANYHGNDFRNRGVHPVMHRLAHANTSSEWDVVLRYPGARYQYLPLNRVPARAERAPDAPVRIVHLARSKALFYYKDSERIAACAAEAVQGRRAEFKLICGLPHAEALNELSKADILVDQMGGRAGFGYGMSAVEALAMGVTVCVDIQKEIEPYLEGHPFVKVSRDNLTQTLEKLIDDAGWRCSLSAQGREWVHRTHAIAGVADRLYALYDELEAAVEHG